MPSGDFARIVELFDRHNVSFVSVTQAFNTTTSTGFELTLNVPPLVSSSVGGGGGGGEGAGGAL